MLSNELVIMKAAFFVIGLPSNVADQGFWNLIGDKYGASQIVWECKNYADLQASDFHQAAYYMNDAGGRVLCFRGTEIKQHYYGHIKRIHADNRGLVLLLTDRI